MSQPEVIDGLQFARGGSEIQGVLGEERLPRLAEMHCRVRDLRYAIRGGRNAKNRLCLRLQASAVVIAQCQRCLEPLSQPVEVDVELELSGDPAEIAAADDDVDRVLATPKMDVAQLVEDELILALPDAPKHEGCRIAAEGRESGRSSPFDALARLKGRGGA